MKAKQAVTLTLALLMSISLSAIVRAAPPKMKMTTDIPPGIATPDKLETRLGTQQEFVIVVDHIHRIHEKAAHDPLTIMR